MAYNDNLPGDWGPELWLDPTGTTPQNGPQVMGNDILTNATETKGQDNWGGFFQNLIGTAASYAIRKDAAQNGLIPATAPNGTPVYTAVPPQGYMPQVQGGSGLNIDAMLLIGAAVLGAVLIAKKA